MSERRALQVICELDVETPRPVTAAEFHALARQLMDELAKLDGCDGNEDIVDPTVSSDAGERRVTVETYVLTDEPAEAVAKASNMLRTALHAAGASTAGWPRVSRIQNTTADVGTLVAC